MRYLLLLVILGFSGCLSYYDGMGSQPDNSSYNSSPDSYRVDGGMGRLRLPSEGHKSYDDGSDGMQRLPLVIDGREY